MFQANLGFKAKIAKTNFVTFMTEFCEGFCFREILFYLFCKKRFSRNCKPYSRPTQSFQNQTALIPRPDFKKSYLIKLNIYKH